MHQEEFNFKPSRITTNGIWKYELCPMRHKLERIRDSVPMIGMSAIAGEHVTLRNLFRLYFQNLHKGTKGELSVGEFIAKHNSKINASQKYLTPDIIMAYQCATIERFWNKVGANMSYVVPKDLSINVNGLNVFIEADLLYSGKRDDKYIQGFILLVEDHDWDPLFLRHRSDVGVIATHVLPHFLEGIEGEVAGEIVFYSPTSGKSLIREINEPRATHSIGIKRKARIILDRIMRQETFKTPTTEKCSRCPVRDTCKPNDTTIRGIKNPVETDAVEDEVYIR